MAMIHKLNNLMNERGINKSQLSRESGVPYTTIDGFFKKGTDNVKLSTLKKLSEYFGCSLDYLVDDDSQEESSGLFIEEPSSVYDAGKTTSDSNVPDKNGILENINSRLDLLSDHQLMALLNFIKAFDNKEDN